MKMKGMTMKMTGLVILVALLGAGMTTMGQAQERTANGAMDAQMTWNALKGLVDGAVSKSDVVSKRVDQIVLCGKQGMLYAPSADGADSDGCKAGSGDYKGPLIGKQTGLDCLLAGGYPTQITGGYICTFNPNLVNAPSGLAGLLTPSSGCPTGWNTYQNWSRTLQTTCSGSGMYGSNCKTPTGHAFSNATPESCTYSVSVGRSNTHDSSLQNMDRGSAVCTAQVLLRGCI